jgi:hypothetical protein
MLRSALLAGAFLAVACDPGIAQQPTSAQRDAIRSTCRSDFMANCAGVQPGGKEAFECLVKNTAKLSEPCKAAVGAVAAKLETPAAPPAAASAPATPAPTEAQAKPATNEEQIKAVRNACTLDDISAHCSWIAPNNPEIVLCLQANVTDLSLACQTAVHDLPPPAPKAAASPPSEPASRPAPVKKPPAPAVAPSPVAAAKPTAQQTSAIRSACRSDFMARCSGVTPGGAEALQCLQRNAAQLSPSCGSAVAAIGGDAPAPATPAGTAAPATTAVPPITMPPFMRPRRRLVIMMACANDAQKLCKGTPPGGGGVIDCLAANASGVSPGCYQALARAAHQ